MVEETFKYERKYHGSELDWQIPVQYTYRELAFRFMNITIYPVDIILPVPFFYIISYEL